MTNLISLSCSQTTIQILKLELDRIEQQTGYRPADWLSSVYDEAYEEYMTGDDFDWDGFEMHLSCVADSFIDFIHDHLKDLNMNI